MVAGDLVTLVGPQTSGYDNGDVGLVVKIEKVGITYVIYWVMMSDGAEVPFWPSEVRKISEEG